MVWGQGEGKHTWWCGVFLSWAVKKVSVRLRSTILRH